MRTEKLCFLYSMCLWGAVLLCWSLKRDWWCYVLIGICTWFCWRLQRSDADGQRASSSCMKKGPFCFDSSNGGGPVSAHARLIFASSFVNGKFVRGNTVKAQWKCSEPCCGYHNRTSSLPSPQKDSVGETLQNRFKAHEQSSKWSKRKKTNYGYCIWPQRLDRTGRSGDS